MKHIVRLNESDIRSMVRKTLNNLLLRESLSFDPSITGLVSYSWDFDEESYQEYLEENQLQNTQETLEEYIRDFVEFELEYCDSETVHFMSREFASLQDLNETFGPQMTQRILKNCIENGEGSFEPFELFENQDFNINDPQQLTDMAKKLLRHGDYMPNARGFILSDGEFVFTEQEHNQCTIIPGIKNTFHFIELGNIRLLPYSLDIGPEPTPQQYKTLRKALNCMTDNTVYLDLLTPNGGYFGAAYHDPIPTYILGEIYRYYNEGIKPQGN